MAVLLFEQRFWGPIVTGKKVHSIRGQRKRPIRPGESLSLRGWEGKAYRSKQKSLLETTCLSVRGIFIGRNSIQIDGYASISSPAVLERFAASDGFDSWESMRMYRDFHYDSPFGVFIQWGEHPILQEMAEP